MMESIIWLRRNATAAARSFGWPVRAKAAEKSLINIVFSTVSCLGIQSRSRSSLRKVRSKFGVQVGLGGAALAVTPSSSASFKRS